jgi:hypothetical protein
MELKTGVREFEINDSISSSELMSKAIELRENLKLLVKEKEN